MAQPCEYPSILYTTTKTLLTCQAGCIFVMGLSRTLEDAKPIPGLYLLHTSSIPHRWSGHDNQKYLQTSPKVPWEAKPSPPQTLVCLWPAATLYWLLLSLLTPGQC